ncbi:MAG: hypothetical protein WBM44_02565 [Waterburya sp.]
MIPESLQIDVEFSWISLHHNLWSHNDGRNPRINNFADNGGEKQAVFVNFWNNVSYNFKFSGMSLSGDDKYVNKDRSIFAKLQNNFFKSGFNTASIHTKKDSGAGIWITNEEAEFLSSGNFYHRWIKNENGEYIEEYLLEESPDIEESKHWQSRVVWFNYNEEKQRGKSYNGFPFKEWPSKLLELNRSDMGLVETYNRAYQSVLKNAGAILPRRDATDSRIIGEVENREGEVISQPKEELYNMPISTPTTIWKANEINESRVLQFHNGYPLPHHSEILVLPQRGSFLITIAGADPSNIDTSSDSNATFAYFEIRCTLSGDSIFKKEDVYYNLAPASTGVSVGFVDSNNGESINNIDRKVLYITVKDKVSNTWFINVKGFQYQSENGKPEPIKWLIRGESSQ